MEIHANEQWVALVTIVRKEVRRFMRIWLQTLLPSAITMTLYFIIFGSLIGRRIGEMGGFDYMQFVVPGLIMMAVITNSYSNVVSSFFGAKFQRFVEEILVSPVNNQIMLLGYVAGGMVRGVLVGIIVTALSLFFTDLRVHDPLVTVAILLLTTLLFSLGGLINAVFANTFDDVSIVPTFVLTPLTYLGGVFYSIDLLSPFWQGVARLNPILYMVNTFRYGLLGVSDVNVTWAIVGLVVCVVALFIIALYLLKNGTRLRA